MRKRVAAIGALVVVVAVASILEVRAGRVGVEPRLSATLQGDAAALHAKLVRLDDGVPASHRMDQAWMEAVARVDRALAERDVSTAVREWRTAYSVSLATRRWQPMIEVGDAALRIRTVSGAQPGYEAKAREAYMVALVQARRLRSADGVLRTSEAFARLGDQEVAQQVRHVFERMVARTSPAPF